MGRSWNDRRIDNSGAGKTGVRYFWADQRALGGYKERNITSIPAYFGNTRRLEIRGDGKTTWDVYIDANRVGQSTQNSAPSEGAEAGEEATYPTAQAYAKFSKFQYYGWDKKFHEWTDTPQKVVDPPLSLSPNTDGSFVVLSNWFCSELVASSVDQSTKASTMISSEKAISIAKELATANAVSHPRTTKYVATTRALAKSGVFHGQKTDDSLWVVEMTGDFIGYSAKVRHGSPPPTGSHMTVTIDAATGEISDYSITNESSGLTSMGRVLSN